MASHPPITSEKAHLLRLLGFFVHWCVPLFPFIFLGWEIPGTGKTVSPAKIGLFAVVCLGCAALRREDIKRLNIWPFWTFVFYLGWLLLGAIVRGHAWSVWYVSEEVLKILFLVVIWIHVAIRSGPFWRNFEAACFFLSAAGVVLFFLNLESFSVPYFFIGSPPKNVASALIVIACLWEIHQKRWGRLSILLPGLVAFVSVGAWIGMLLGVSTFSRRSLFPWLLSALLVLTAALFIAKNISEPVPSGPKVFVKPENVFWKVSVQPRLYILEVGRELIRERPWFGHGLGRFPKAFMAAEGKRNPGEDLPWFRYGRPPKEPGGISAHSDLLRIAAETGLPSGALWLLAMMGIFWKHRENKLVKALLVAFLFQSLTENIYALSFYVPVLWVSLFVGSGPAEGGISVQRRGSA